MLYRLSRERPGKCSFCPDRTANSWYVETRSGRTINFCAACRRQMTLNCPFRLKKVLKPVGLDL
jgi:hypothetical protein